MASPQKEHGFTPIANELLEALCRTRLPGEARQVLDTVIRQTYGYGRSQDRLALSQISAATGLNRFAASRALAKLRAMRIVEVTKNGNKFDPNTIKINKDWEKWRLLPKKVTPPIVVENDNKKLSKTMHTKESSIYLSDTNKPGGNPKERTPKQVAQDFFDGVGRLVRKEGGDTAAAARAFMEMLFARRGGDPADIAARAALWREIRAFADYWTEPTHDGKRTRWGCQKTFEVARRLDTWLRRAASPRPGAAPAARGKQIIGL